MQIDNMRASFYANAAVATSVRRLSEPKVAPQQDLDDANARASQAEEDAAKLMERCEEEAATNQALVDELEALRSKIVDESSFSQKAEELQDRLAQLDSASKNCSSWKKRWLHV